MGSNREKFNMILLSQDWKKYQSIIACPKYYSEFVCTNIIFVDLFKIINDDYMYSHRVFYWKGKKCHILFNISMLIRCGEKEFSLAILNLTKRLKNKLDSKIYILLSV